MKHNFAEIVHAKTNDELLQMVYEFEIWSPEMLSAVETELSRRNMLPQDIAERKQEVAEKNEAELLKGKEGSIAVLIIGWLTVLGFLGLFIGYHYAYSRVHSQATGKVYHKYNDDTRKDGRILMNIAIILMILVFFYQVLQY